MAGAVIVTGGVALGPFAAVGFAAFDVGKAGYEAYEFVDCIPARGAALESLINNFEYTGPLTPNPQPGPTPDITDWNRSPLK